MAVLAIFPPLPFTVLDTVTSAVLAFLASSIDDYALLICLYASPQARIGEITVARMLCTTLVLCMAAAFATASLALPPPVSRLAGLAPLAIGVKRLIGNRNSRSATDAGTGDLNPRRQPVGAIRRVICLAVLFFGSSLDNLALYVPLFVHARLAEAATTFGFVFTLTLMLCGIALISGALPGRFHCVRLKLGTAVPYLMMFIGIKALAT
ncbi:cadmium resistance transporter [Paraburkholderia sp.]|uniref:cadmium resistance transporter n=1 Tax=Paraburkholderia sp. TaxID=1926495 RepID=UPI0039E480BE